MLSLISLAYLGGWILNQRVPVTIDQGFSVYVPTAEALRIDIPLLLLFGLQHSILPRAWFKRMLAPDLHRGAYLLTTGLVLLNLYRRWEPLPDYVWYVRDPLPRILCHVLAAAGVVLVAWSVQASGAAEFLGARAAIARLRGVRYVPLEFRERGPYRWSRHPMMVGTLLFFWAAPEMSQGRLLFAGFMTAYVLLALVFEERDLTAVHGSAYAEYRRRVRRFL